VNPPIDLVVKRVYDEPSGTDGYRVLVDRLWPRGLSKEKARLDEWVKELGPSTELRKWFGHEVAKWPEFRERYRAELDRKSDLWQPIVDRAREGRVTLLFGAHDEEHNQAVVLQEFLRAATKP
jgi:uncharacterized protein YeaO (DUF488 family)